MSWMSMSQEAGQALANSLAEVRPSVGRRVAVTGGRKHKGKAGVVFWHGRDPYSKAGRYGSPFQNSCSDIMGKYGFRVGVQTDDGEKFFICAQQVDVVKVEG